MNKKQFIKAIKLATEVFVYATLSKNDGSYIKCEKKNLIDSLKNYDEDYQFDINIVKNNNLSYNIYIG